MVSPCCKVCADLLYWLKYCDSFKCIVASAVVKMIVFFEQWLFILMVSPTFSLLGQADERNW